MYIWILFSCWVNAYSVRLVASHHPQNPAPPAQHHQHAVLRQHQQAAAAHVHYQTVALHNHQLLAVSATPQRTPADFIGAPQFQYEYTMPPQALYYNYPSHGSAWSPAPTARVVCTPQEDVRTVVRSLATLPSRRRTYLNSF